MLESAQIRAARALLGWRQEDLAKASKISLATIARIEQGKGVVQGNFSTIMKIQQTLEGQGISFITEPGGGIGVRLNRPKPQGPTLS
jgi:transcriptional regulator with XRE-family HTH domain